MGYKQIFERIPFNKTNAALVVILLLFASIYSSISLVNHYNFRTFAQDLGVFNKALYCFSHFKSPHYTLCLDGSAIHYLADHFSPITIIFSRLYYLFGSYTALLIQIASILFGGLGVFRIAQLYLKDSVSAMFSMLHFLSMWGIFSALGYDFHNNVVASMFVPWFIYYWKKKKKKQVILFFVLLLISKENIPLWVCFIILGLILEERNFSFRKLIRFELPLLIISASYFLFVVGFLQPYLIGDQTDSQLARYAHLGDGVGGIVRSIFTKPRYFFSLFFESPVADPMYQGIKSELYFVLLLSGGFFLIYKPQYLLMLAPVVMQKMLSDNPNIWSVGGQYSIEFVPIVCVAVILSFAHLRSRKFIMRFFLTICFISAAWQSYSVIESNKSMWYNNLRWAFYKKEHYVCDRNRCEILSVIEKVPDDVPVTSVSNLAPYLERRTNLYMIPYVKDSKYAVLFTDARNSYPLNQEQYVLFLDSLETFYNFEILEKNKSAILYKKR